MIFRITSWRQPKGGPARPRQVGVARAASNAGRAAARASARVLSGGRVKVDRKTYEARSAVCRGCPGKFFDGRRCAHPRCGCFTAAKAWLASERCPAGYWGDEG